jgi:hypothetical protein
MSYDKIETFFKLARANHQSRQPGSLAASNPFPRRTAVYFF